MATYGSTLDSLMANRVAQQAADAAEQNAYRSYLNAVANTNIRRSEGEALDRYRQGELGIRGQDVMGMNEYRRGQIGLGGRQIDVQRELGMGDQDIRRELGRGQLGLGGRQLDIQSELNKGTIANQLEDIRNRGKYYEGIGQYYGAMPDVQRQQIGVQYELGRKGLENQALDIGGSNRYREGLISNQASDIGGSNEYRRGLINVSRLQAGTQAADVAARNQIAADVARMNYDLGGRQLGVQEKLGLEPYAYQRELLRLYSSNPNAASSMMGIKPTELDLLRANAQLEDQSAYNQAVAEEAAKALEDYSGVDFLYDSDRKNRVQALMKENKLNPAQAARVYAEETVGALRGGRSSFAPALRYDVKQDRGTNMSNINLGSPRYITTQPAR